MQLVKNMATFCRNLHGSVVTLGGVDPAHYTGKLTCTSINEHKEGIWKVKMEGMSIEYDDCDSGPFCHGGCEASIDSGCSYLVSPPDQVELLHKTLGGTYAPNITNYVSETSIKMSLFHNVNKVSKCQIILL